MTDLTIITVAENDRGTLDLMLRSVFKFTHPHPNVIICDNGNNGSVIEKYKGTPGVEIVSHKPTIKGGSNKHGIGLNHIFPMVKTKRTAIVESDCIVLSDNWHNMYGKNVVAATKVPGLYHIFFVLFETKLFKGVDFRPGKAGNRANRPYQVKEDVGWQMSKFINDAYILKFVDCKSGQGKYFDGRFQSDELWSGDQAIVAHLGRGSNLGGKAIRKGFAHPKDQMIEWKKIAERTISYG